MRNYFASLSVFCLLISSCKNQSVRENVDDQYPTVVSAPKEVFETGKVIPKLICKSNPAFSFSLFLPSDYDTSKKFPVIIFFDPHAGGELVVNKYSHLAEEIHCILIGSNDSKNGLTMEQTNQIANALIDDATRRFSVTNNISLAGFSGGAKVALNASEQNEKVSTVVYCGAASPVSEGSKFSLLGFAGVNDMNYSDVIAFDQSLQGSNINHFITEWNGKHEWPDSVTFKDAFYWILFDQMRNGSIVHDQQIIKDFLDENATQIIRSKNDWHREKLFEKEIVFLNHVVDVSSMRAKAQKISQTSSYKKEVQARAQIQTEEQSEKQKYIEAIQTKDLTWWRNEISHLQSEKDPMHQRLLGFISLAGYSVSTNAIQQNNFPLAEKMLAIYGMADPKNYDQPFLEACLLAKQGNNDAAIASLQRAFDLGMNNDADKIRGEPALQPLLNDQRLMELLAKMK